MKEGQQLIIVKQLKGERRQWVHSLLLKEERDGWRQNRGWEGPVSSGHPQHRVLGNPEKKSTKERDFSYKRSHWYAE